MEGGTCEAATPTSDYHLPALMIQILVDLFCSGESFKPRRNAACPWKLLVGLEGSVGAEDFHLQDLTVVNMQASPGASSSYIKPSHFRYQLLLTCSLCFYRNLFVTRCQLPIEFKQTLDAVPDPGLVIGPGKGLGDVAGGRRGVVPLKLGQ